MLGQKVKEPTYRECLSNAILEAQEWLNKDYEDSLARGQALWEIVEREKILAKKEKNAAKLQAREERKAKGEPPSMEAFEKHLREKMSLWPATGTIRKE